MPVTVIVGGQYGSEGKGKVAHFFAKQMNASVAVRVGGPNSGHTVLTEDNKKFVLQQLPTAAILPNVMCVLPAGSYIDLETLQSEIALVSLPKERLIIDPRAMLITSEDKLEETNSHLPGMIGSTASGTGAAVSRRISRNRTSITLAKDEESLQDYVKPSVSFMRSELNKGSRIIIEGTQGFGLSLFHAPDYPYATSRDTTAAGFVSETGLSPLDIDDVILVLRSFPIRVAGNSGPLEQEIDWSTLSEELDDHELLVEYTSVTKRIRRVGRFQSDIVKTAIEVNAPTRIVLNHLDYIDSTCRKSKKLTAKVAKFVFQLERELNKRIDYYGFSADSVISSDSFQMDKIVHFGTN
jgi:adenylosuccinate synthase